MARSLRGFLGAAAPSDDRLDGLVIAPRDSRNGRQRQPRLREDCLSPSGLGVEEPLFTLGNRERQLRYSQLGCAELIVSSHEPRITPVLA
jgi:hypothetical protein